MAALVGMKEICIHLKRSEATVLDLIRTEGLPADKIRGVWESDTEAITAWRLERITKATNLVRLESVPSTSQAGRR